jgi:hypothetical protein
MKRCLPILFLSIVLASCSNPYWINTKGYSILHEDLDTVWKHVSSYQYLPIYDIVSPKQFEANGGGDCKGFTTDLMYYLGPDSEGVRVTWPNGLKHAIVRYKGRYIEPQEYGRYYTFDQFTIDYITSYYDWMRGVTEYGNRSLQ